MAVNTLVVLRRRWTRAVRTVRMAPLIIVARSKATKDLQQHVAFRPILRNQRQAIDHALTIAAALSLGICVRLVTQRVGLTLRHKRLAHLLALREVVVAIVAAVECVILHVAIVYIAKRGP